MREDHVDILQFILKRKGQKMKKNGSQTPHKAYERGRVTWTNLGDHKEKEEDRNPIQNAKG